MAQRWLATEGVEAHQNDIAFSQDARIAEHLQLFLDGAAPGVFSGFGVTINGVLTDRIDVAAGTGYVPNGEYVVLTPGQTSIALASNVLGTVNLVCAVFTETQSNPVPHETNATSPFTRAVRSVRIRVFTQAQFNALAVSDSNLSNDSQDRCLILARITATEGALTAGAIQSPTAFNTINFASAPITITGVAITAVSSNTAEGIGTLTFTFVGLTIAWTPPGGVIGPAVAVGGGGNFVISGGGASPPTITVTVIAGSLPVANRTDSITITNLYSQVVARLSYEDALHRSRLGTGTPSPTNPHGLRVSDLGGVELAELEAHVDLQHQNGIWRGSAATALSVVVTPLPGIDSLTISAPIGVDTYWVEGRRLSTILNTTLPFSAADPAAKALYEILVDNTGAISKSQRLIWAAPFTVTGVDIIDINDSTGIGPRTLSFTAAGQLLQWDSGPTVAVSSGGRFKLISADDLSIIEVFVVPGSLPVLNAADVITIGTVASSETFLRLAMVAWAGNATGTLGFGITQALLDKRVYGTLGEFELRDLEARNYEDVTGAHVARRLLPEDRRTDELRASGVIFGLDRTDANSLNVTAGAGLTVNVSGGTAYIFGRRFERAEQLSFAVPAALTGFVFLDLAGTLRYSSTLTLAQIVGDSTLNNPGRGIVLAHVTTDGVGVTSVVDHRRNIARLDNIVGSLTVGNVATRHRAMFFSLRAAKAYADVFGINEIHVTGQVIESGMTAPIALTAALRIVVDPGATVQFSGTATSAFSIGAGGALEFISGGGEPSTGAAASLITLIAYGGNADSYVLLRDLRLTLTGSARLFTNTTSTVGGRGVKLEGCDIMANLLTRVVEFGAAWTGLLGLYNCRLTSDTTMITDVLGVAGTINRIEVRGCDFVGSGGAAVCFNGSTNVTWNDWKITDSRLAGSSVFIMAGTTNDFLMRGCRLASTSSTMALSSGVAKTHTRMQILGNDFASTGGLFIDMGANMRMITLAISDNSFASAGTSLAIRLIPDGVSGSSEIVVSGNTFAQGSVRFGNAAAGVPSAIVGVQVSDNVFSGQSDIASSGAIWLDANCQRYAISGNSITFGGAVAATPAGIRIGSTCPRGAVTGNTLRTDRTDTGLSGINNSAQDVSITGNNIYLEGAGGVAGRFGINNAANDVVIGSNTIQSDDTDSLGRGISSFGDRCAITGNSVDLTAAAAAGSCIELTIGTQTAITGNTIRHSGASGSSIQVGASNRCTIGQNVIIHDADNAAGGGAISNAGANAVINGNSIDVTSATSATRGIVNTGADVSITGNTIRSVGTGDSRGIDTQETAAIGSNAIQMTGALTTGIGLRAAANQCTITGNTVEVSNAAGAGTGILMTGNDCAVTGNLVIGAPGPGGTMKSFNSTGFRTVVVGNKFAHTGAPGEDVLMTGGDSIFVGNIVFDSSGVGSRTMGAIFLNINNNPIP